MGMLNMRLHLSNMTDPSENGKRDFKKAKGGVPKNKGRIKYNILLYSQLPHN